MSAACTPHLDTAPFSDVIDSLMVVVDGGAPLIGSSKQAVELIDAVERARRLAAVSAVDVLAQIDTSRAFYDHGHASARIMFQHVAGVSGAESHRLDKIRRMIAQAEQIASAWRKAELSVDKAGLMGRAFANPRTRDRFLLDQKWFLKQARRFGMTRFTKKVARWLEVHDDDGPEPAPDPSYERRRAWLAQDHFSKAWKLDAELGSMQGSTFNETFQAYIEAEFAHDWTQAEKTHGPDTCRDLLARTDAQRCADAAVRCAH